MQEKHISVLLNETIDSLCIKEDGIYIDLTLGRAGHSAHILKKLKTGLLVGFDKDKTAIKESANYLSKISTNFKLIHSDYKNLKEELDKLGINAVDGIIADLGVSSPQLDQADRGFSYNKEAKLDMRMDQNQSLDAYNIINTWTEEELVNIFRNNADVKLPKRVAKGIISNRPIDTTIQLVDIIRSSLPAAIVRKKNPAKAVFQAIRIAVNNELDSLKNMLEDAISLLKENGSLAIITFHSIEDKIVKRKFGEYIKDDTGKLPIIQVINWKAKAVKPTKWEIENNRRSRSAKLRILKRIH